MLLPGSLHRDILLLAVLAGAGPAQLAAQPPDRGPMVRAMLSGAPAPVQGHLLEAGSDTLVLWTLRGERAAVARAAILTLEQGTSRPGRPFEGAAIGGLVGAATGILFGVLLTQATPRYCPFGPCEPPRIDQAMLVSGGLGLALGAMGGIVLSASPRWTWTPADSLLGGPVR